MPLVAATVAALHPTAARAIGAETGEGRTALVLLLIGVIVASGYAPFGLLLAQGGDAAAHSWLLLATVAVNIAGNFTLIHTLGINGAAVATTFSAMASVLLLRAFARSRLRLRV